MDIQRILKTEYGINAKSIKPLVSYSDRNMLIFTQENRKYIFKIQQAADYEILTFQNDVLEYLHSAGLSVPQVCPALNGHKLLYYQQGDEHLVLRLLIYLDGQLLGEIEQPALDTVKEFGRLLGRMDTLLEEYPHDGVFPEDFKWDLKNLPNCRDLFGHFKDPRKKRLVHYFTHQFTQRVLARKKEFKQTLIHNDPNPWNILLEENRVSGIIDFGDMVNSYRVFNVAIALTYLLFDNDYLLETAREFIKAYHSEHPLSESELEVMYYVIAGRLCNSLCISSQMADLEPGNAYAQIDHEPAWRLLNRWIGINPFLLEANLRKACGLPSIFAEDESSYIVRRKKYFSVNLSTSYKNPIHMDRAAMQYMYDTRGNCYLDGVNNICHVGHCHPVVVEAGQKQMANLNTNTRYLYPSLLEYAEQLLDRFPEGLNKVFFVNSGSAATDLAYRMAQTHTGRDDIAVISAAYHGNTKTAIDLSPYKYLGKGGEGEKAYVHALPMPDTFRGIHRGEGAGNLYSQELNKLLDDVQLGCFIAESLLGCGGQIPLPDGYLKNCYQLIRDQGGICIADEVQVGFGRVGEAFWGFELQNVIPDIVVLGKPMGNGHPIGAVVCTEEICHSFENGMEFFSSFGGNPVSCEIGKAVLQVIDAEGLQEYAKQIGNFILNQWNEFKDRYDFIGDVRGKGLFLGMEIVKTRNELLPDAELAGEIVEKMKENYILLSTDGPDNNVIKFKPPLTFNIENAEWMNKTMNGIFSGVVQK